MSDKRKRNYQQSSHHVSRFRPNPSRGGPGILLTCDTSREVKCEREGREILRYYNDKQQRASSPPGEKLTLEQELAVLQQQKPRDDGPFQIFDTGCAGTVFFMYVDKSSKDNLEMDEKDAADKESPSKRIRTTPSAEEENGTTTAAAEAAVESKNSTIIARATAWDPVETVKMVAKDICNRKSSSGIPASRFVTRMIPIQVTCFASMKELESNLPKLLEAHTKEDSTETETNEKTTKTFRVHVKRRNCSNLSSLQFIETAAPLVMNRMGWKVQLNDPDYVVWIEVCKTLMGLSILKRNDMNLAKNFNLAELRDKRNESEESTTNAADDPSKP